MTWSYRIFYESYPIITFADVSLIMKWKPSMKIISVWLSFDENDGEIWFRCFCSNKCQVMAHNCSIYAFLQIGRWFSWYYKAFNDRHLDNLYDTLILSCSSVEYHFKFNNTLLSLKPFLHLNVSQRVVIN